MRRTPTRSRRPRRCDFDALEPRALMARLELVGPSGTVTSRVSYGTIDVTRSASVPIAMSETKILELIKESDVEGIVNENGPRRTEWIDWNLGATVDGRSTGDPTFPYVFWLGSAGGFEMWWQEPRPDDLLIDRFSLYDRLVPQSFRIVPEAGESEGQPVTIEYRLGVANFNLEPEVSTASFRVAWMFDPGGGQDVSSGVIEGETPEDSDSIFAPPHDVVISVTSRIGQIVTIDLESLANITIDEIYGENQDQGGPIYINRGGASTQSMIWLNVLGATPPDIRLAGLTWNGADGGVDVVYEVADAALPRATDLSFYWVGGEAADDPFCTVALPGGTEPGVYSIHLPIDALRPPAQGAGRLMVVADHDDLVAESDEANNIEYLAVPDVRLESLSWSAQDGGVDISYTIAGTALPCETSIGLFWVGGAAADAPFNIITLASGTAPGTYSAHVAAASLRPVTPGATQLMANADRDDRIIESDESNNAAYLAIPDVTIKDLTWGGGGGVDLTYVVAGIALPRDTAIVLYWVGGDATGEFFLTLDLAAGTVPGEYPVHVPAGTVRPIPGGANLLVVDADRDDRIVESDETNNTAFLEVLAPDIALTGLTWHGKSRPEDAPSGGGVDIRYAIGNAPLPFNTTIVLYWSDSPELSDGGRREPAGSVAVQSAVGEYTVQITADALAVPSKGGWVKYLLAVADPEHEIAEGNESNNTTTLAASAADILADSVTPSPSGAAMRANLEPARGALTLEHAIAICGVDHFNWIQTIRTPSNMQFQIWRDVTAWDEESGRPADGEFVSAPSPVYDPVPNRGGEEYYLRLDGNRVGDVTYFPASYPNADAFEPYLQENPAEWAEDVPYGGTRSPWQFAFADQPSFPASFRPYFLSENSYFQFTTFLVGIGADGAWSRFDVPRTGFVWRTNAYHDPSVTNIFLQGRPPGAPPVLGGGVFDVRYDDGTPILGAPSEPPPLPPIVLGTEVDDGSAQRSMVRSLTVRFSDEVTLGPGAIEVRTGDGRSVDLVVETARDGGRTVATVRFRGADVVAGSLPDGAYTLTVHGDRIVDAHGQAGAGHAESFFRLFGDTDGDGDVDNNDAFAFKSALNRRAGQDGYVAFLDFDGDGKIDNQDFAAMKARYGKKLSR